MAENVLQFVSRDQLEMNQEVESEELVSARARQLFQMSDRQIETYFKASSDPVEALSVAWCDTNKMFGRMYKRLRTF